MCYHCLQVPILFRHIAVMQATLQHVHQMTPQKWSRALQTKRYLKVQLVHLLLNISNATQVI